MGERFLRKASTSPTNGPVLRVKRVKVEGLFGLYNHDIPLNAEERVTIVHGPNGVGKTVLLKMIAAVFNGQYGELAKVRFTKFELCLSDSTVFTIQTAPRSHPTLQAMRISSVMNDEPLHLQEFDEPEKVWLKRANDPSNFIPAHVPPPPRAEWNALPYPPGLLPLPPPPPPFITEPEWLSKFRSLIQIHLIETQRLLRTTEQYTEQYERATFLVPTVREYARELSVRITSALAQYASESQVLDQSFPQRLIKTTGHTGVMAFDVKARMTALNEKRAHLRKIGLLDSTTSSPFEVESLDTLDPVQSNVMSLYIEDTQQKLAVLDDIARRITLLLDYVNGKFRNKSIRVSREDGFVVVGHDGAPIEPDSLSSGEQHELVQLYDLLFQVKPGTLVLIDEPELSLHVLWQKKYLSELLEIAKTAQFDAIVATHSPFIVGDRSDLMVPLAADIDT